MVVTFLDLLLYHVISLLKSQIFKNKFQKMYIFGVQCRDIHHLYQYRIRMHVCHK